ncbi:hypothetical protein LOK49_Contig310G00005 [Camellia lanceoleosa]|nr:hypothetical protein LOK49_Contig310G00005 [Camellia lanceoleosa]
MEEDDEDGVEDKEEKSVNSNGLAVGVEAPEFDKVALSSKPNQSKTKTEKESEKRLNRSYLARAPSVAKGAELSSVAKSLQKIVCPAPKQRDHRAVNTDRMQNRKP